MIDCKGQLTWAELVDLVGAGAPVGVVAGKPRVLDIGAVVAEGSPARIGSEHAADAEPAEEIRTCLTHAYLAFEKFVSKGAAAYQLGNTSSLRSLKSSNVELGYYLDGRLFKCCLSAAANP